MTLNTTHIKAYESARMYVLRAMRRITRMDQQIHHISGTRMLNENKMATSAEKIRRRTFGFWNKIILNAPLNSPERMLMGMPYIIWDDNVFQPEGRATHYAKTMARYLTERALQLYYYTEILGKQVDFDHKALIKKLLRFEGTNADRASQENWMQIIQHCPKQWEWVVKYGQFEPEPEGDETTEKEKEKRRKRQNTFAPELPTGWIRQNGGMVQLRQRMRNL